MQSSEQERLDEAESELQHGIDAMAARNDQLGGRVDAVRAEWERKRANVGVPGAAPPDPGSEARARPEE